MQARSPETTPDGVPTPLSVFLGYLERVDAGGEVSLDALCEQHPRLAGELRNLWADFQGTSRVLLDARSELFAGVLNLLRRHDAEAPVVAGQRIARYEVGTELGRGGIGVVFEARDVELGRPVALKFLHDQWLDEPGFVERFTKEAQLGGQLQHPGIPAVYEFVRTGPRPFLSMKLIEGHTLAEELRRGDDRPSALPRLLRIFEAVCQTVGYVHSHGVIHRDLKPSNVMIGAFGEVQVVDWGMAKVLGGDGAAITEPEPGAGRRPGRVPGESDTVPGSRLGTPAYMSPEQAGAGTAVVDQRSDVFSLGAILCEILTGEPPYTSDESGSAKSADLLAMAAAANLGPTSERLRGPDVPATLAALCLECMAADPAERPRDAGALAQRIDDYTEDVEVRARRAEIEAATVRVRARGTRRLLAVSAVALVIAVGLLIAAWLNWQRAETLSRKRQLDAGRATARLGDVHHAEELLWELHRTDPDNDELRWALRGLYSRNPSALCWQAHDVPVSVIASALDGTLVATAGGHPRDEPRELRVWDMDLDASPPSVQLRAEWHEPGARCLALAADGSALFVGSLDGSVVEYPLAPAGDPIVLCPPGGAYVVALVSWEADRSVALFRRPTASAAVARVEIWRREAPGTLARSLPPAPVADLSVQGDELWVLTADGLVTPYRPGAPAEAAARPSEVAATEAASHQFVGSDAGPLVASGSRDLPTVAVTRATAGEPGQAAPWELRVRKNHGQLLAHGRFLFQVQKPNHRALHLYHLDAQDGAVDDLARLAAIWRAPAGVSQVVSLRPGRIATALEDGTVRVWRVPKACSFDAALQVVAWDRTGERAALAWGRGNRGGAVVLPSDRIGGERGRAVGTPRQKPVAWVAFHPHRDLLACAGRDGRIEIVEGDADASSLLDWSCAGEISHIAFDASGDRLAVAHDDGITLLRTADWQVEHQLVMPSSAFKRVLFVEGNRVLACGRSSTGGGWLLWDPASTAPPQSWDNAQAVPLRAMAQSPDGRVAIGGDDGVIRLCTADGIDTGKQLVGHTGSVYALAFHPTSPRPLLASADSIGEIRVWDAATGELLCILQDRLPDTLSGLFCLTFSPDGRQLVAAGELQYPVVFDFAELDRRIDANGRYQQQRAGVR